MVRSLHLTSFHPLPLSVAVSAYYMQDSPLFINRQSCPVRLRGNLSPSGAVVLSAANTQPCPCKVCLVFWVLDITRLVQSKCQPLGTRVIKGQVSAFITVINGKIRKIPMLQGSNVPKE